jgi:DNA-binding transcriptional regulator YiaG
VAKVETAIKEAIQRGARRELRVVTVPLRRDVRRLRRMVSGLREEVSALKGLATSWERVARTAPWTAQVSEAETRAARLSAGLIKKLRVRLALSQAALARLAGVSPGAVVHWERGGATPSGEHRRALIGLRKLGRREVRRLLTSLAPPPRRPAAPAKGAGRAAGRGRRVAAPGRRGSRRRS